MQPKQFLSGNFRWEWRTPLLLAVCLIPSLLLCIFNSPHLGIAAVLGLIPVAFQGVSPTRKKRSSVILLGLLLPLSLVLGSLIKIHAGMWLAALIMATLSLATVGIMAKRPSTYLGVVMCVPVVGIGMSYNTLGTSLMFFVVMVAGSVMAWAVSLLFPEYTPSPEHRTISPQHGVIKPPPPPVHFAPRAFGLLFAAAMATSTLIGYPWDHTGWVVGSTGFVMRPSERMQRFRSLWRMLSVLVGAAAASLMLLMQPGGLLTVAVAGGMMILAGGLRQSRAYVMPAFTTFIVFLLILYPAPSGGAVWARFFERVGWVTVGVLVACFYEMLLPWGYEKIRTLSLRRREEI